MKLTYIRLENVAALVVGLDKDLLEIDFKKSKNKIISIQGPNGVGKTTLLSSLSPFATVTSLDERSSLPYIAPGKNGYKEIHYNDKGNNFVIKHYYKAAKDKKSHTVKSYFAMNDVELNENGNVTSFLQLVELHFGLTQELMRLLRLGSNVNSFITLSPAKRKEYIGNLISEIDMYLHIHKKINEDIRVIKVLLSSNTSNLYKCHISDPLLEDEKLRKLYKQIKSHEKDRDSLISKIAKIQALEKDNNIEDLKRKRQEAESSIYEFNRVEESIKSMSLGNVTIDKLISKRSDTMNSRIDIQSKINSYRISIDNALKNIERLEASVKKITSNNDVQSLVDAITSIRDSIKLTNLSIINFSKQSCTSEDVYRILSKLSSFNQISQMIHTFGNRPIEVYLKLRQSNKSVDKFLKDQMKKNVSRVNSGDLKTLLSQVFQGDQIVTPNCDTQFNDCPYYRLSEAIDDFKEKLEEESFDDETLRYIQVIANNIDNVMNEIDLTRSIQIPDRIRDGMKEISILNRLGSNLPFFDLSDLQEYLTILKEYELYRSNVEKLKQYEYQLSVYKKSGIDSHLSEIQQLQENISFYRKNIVTLTGEIETIAASLVMIDEQIGLVTKYNDAKKYKRVFEATLDSTNKILLPLENASNERLELEFSLRQMNNLINQVREEHKQLESKLSEYNRLTKEGKLLNIKHKHLNMILDSVSTKKGIPVLFMRRYLGKIQKLANNLLELIYGDKFRLAKFNVTQDVFEVPYIKKGTKVPDVKYASQSEVPLVTMALSCALANKASGAYNILLLDEIDGGLDDKNRSAFLRMLDRQMQELETEQVFIVSHNLSQMVNIPMDCIILSPVSLVASKLQNVIYE